MTILAVSVDPPPQSAEVARRNKLPFPVLSDPGQVMLAAYGLVHPGGGPDGASIAQPATMLIAGDGTIVWRRHADRVQDRPTPQQILEQIHALRDQ